MYRSGLTVSLDFFTVRALFLLETTGETTRQNLKVTRWFSSIALGVFLLRLFVTMYLDRPLMFSRHSIR